MLRSLSPLWQSALGTLLTWGLTAAGAGLVFLVPPHWSHKRLLNASLGFAAGVMTAASFWSLLAPAIEMAEQSGVYGSMVWLPVAIGFAAGAGFVMGADRVMPLLGVSGDASEVVLQLAEPDSGAANLLLSAVPPAPSGVSLLSDADAGLRRRQAEASVDNSNQRCIDFGNVDYGGDKQRRAAAARASWRRIALLVLAITVHNVPEGLAVGVGFGAVGSGSGSASTSFESARNLAIGIGIQNFPEGLAVSLPLHASGMSPMRSFWWGQLSGLVEPAAGMLGCILVTMATPLLPYALSFAAGAMIYVVFDSILPESTDTKLTSATSVLGFLVMMVLDVGLS